MSDISWVHDLDCPECNSSLVMCMECWQDLAGCECESTTIDLFCGDCLHEYSVDLVGLVNDDETIKEEMTYDEWYEKNKSHVNEPQPKGNAGAVSKYQNKCRHFFDPIELVDGYSVYPSSLANDRKDNEFTPDFGLYADFMWEPGWRNEYIVWPDFEIPDFASVAIEQIHSACERVVNGERVEIGCIGGHGRTGTIAACMAVTLSYMVGETPLSPSDARALVQREYCRHAIETDEQEWWVEYYSHTLYGDPVELRKKPECSYFSSGSKGSSYYSGDAEKHKNIMPYCSQREHYEMISAGADTCLQQIACEHWDEDLEDFYNKVPLDEDSPDGKVVPLDETRINNWRIMLKVKLQKYGTQTLEAK